MKITNIRNLEKLLDALNECERQIELLEDTNVKFAKLVDLLVERHATHGKTVTGSSQ